MSYEYEYVLLTVSTFNFLGILNQKLLEAAGVAEKERSEMAGGNKLAALTGDFLLAKAAGGLARLNHPQVVDSMAQAIGSILLFEPNYVCTLIILLLQFSKFVHYLIPMLLT